MKLFKITYILIVSVFFILSGCRVTINPTPDINVRQNNTDIPSDSGIYEFGIVEVGESSEEVEFTIENLGSSELLLVDTPEYINISGDISDFIVNQDQILPSLKTNNSTAFTVSFEPKSEGAKSITISITSNDPDENPYIFEITGGSTIPEINVKVGVNNVPSGTGVVVIGNYLVGQSSNKIVITIENLGSGELQLTDSHQPIEVIGTDASMFAVNQNDTDTTIQAGETTTFSIVFSPTSEGSKIVTISIKNNDFDENPYTFKFAASGFTAPEINVQDSLSNNIVSGSGIIDFGNVDVNSHVSKSFTIQNLGNGKLVITKIIITGTDSSEFNISAQPSDQVAPGYSTTFTVEFAPTKNQNSTAVVSISNNDDDENPYTFTIKGKGLVSEINVIAPDLRSLTSGTGTYDFGRVKVGLSVERTFTIENLGDGKLILSGSPLINISGTGAGAFTVTAQPSTSINPSSDTTFKIEYAPTVLQQYKANVSITNNDLDEDPFTFEITSKPMGPQFDFNGDGLDDVVIGASSSDNNLGCGYIFFGSTSPSSLINSSNADVKIINNNGDVNLGSNISVIGNFNGDRFDDIAIASRSATNEGCVYIFYGSANPTSRLYTANADVQILGDDKYDNFGFSVSSARDFNNDGLDDIVIGAYQDDDGGDYSGCAFIFLGKNNYPSSLRASNADVKLVGEDVRDCFGFSVSSAGDFNNDGISDIIVGACEQTTINPGTGKAYVFYGKSNPTSQLDASNADIIIHGSGVGYRFAYTVSDAGDFNHDGIDDIMIAETVGQAVYLFLGSNNHSSILYSYNAVTKIIAESSDHSFGISLSSVGDFNYDGIDDILIGASSNNGGGNQSGRCYVIYGRTSISSTFNASASDIKISGDGTSNYLGWTTSSAGDFNNDGKNDFITSATGADYNGLMNCGCVYIVFGKTNSSSAFKASSSDVTIYGEYFSGQLGSAVSGGN